MKPIEELRAYLTSLGKMHGGEHGDYYAWLARQDGFLGRCGHDTIPGGRSWVRLTRPKPRMCYSNALAFCVVHDAARYYEGYVMTVMPVEHAWVVVGDTVLDLTLEAADRFVERVWGSAFKARTPEDTPYVGVHIPTAFALRCLYDPHVPTAQAIFAYYRSLREEVSSC